MGRKKKQEEILPPKVKEKRIRKDVKERKEANKDTEFTCVKMSFNSLVENNYSIIITSKCNYNLYVSNKNADSFIVRRIARFNFSKKYIEFDYFVIGERKDIKIDVEQDIN